MLDRDIRIEKAQLDKASAISDAILDCLEQIERANRIVDLKNDIPHNVKKQVRYLSEITTKGAQQKVVSELKEIAEGMKKELKEDDGKEIKQQKEEEWSIENAGNRIETLMERLIKERTKKLDEAKAEGYLKVVKKAFVKLQAIKEKTFEYQASSKNPPEQIEKLLTKSLDIYKLEFEYLSARVKVPSSATKFFLDKFKSHEEKEAEKMGIDKQELGNLENLKSVDALWNKIWKDVIGQQSKNSDAFKAFEKSQKEKGKGLAELFIKYCKEMKGAKTLGEINKIKNKYDESNLRDSKEYFIEEDESIVVKTILGILEEEQGDLKFGGKIKNKSDIYSRMGDIEADQKKKIEQEIEGSITKINNILKGYDQQSEESSSEALAKNLEKLNKEVKKILKEDCLGDKAGQDYFDKKLDSIYQPPQMWKGRVEELTYTGMENHILGLKTLYYNESKKGEEFAEKWISCANEIQSAETLGSIAKARSEYNEACKDVGFSELALKIMNQAIIKSKIKVGMDFSNKVGMEGINGELTKIENKKISDIKMQIEQSADNIIAELKNLEVADSENSLGKADQGIKKILNEEHLGDTEGRNFFVKQLKMKNHQPAKAVKLEFKYKSYKGMEADVKNLRHKCQYQLADAAMISKNVLEYLNSIEGADSISLVNDIPHAIKQLIGKEQKLTPGARKRFFH